MFVATFGDVADGEALADIDSAGALPLAVNRGDAAAAFGLHEGDTFSASYGSPASGPHGRMPKARVVVAPVTLLRVAEQSLRPWKLGDVAQ